ncbi:efflux RND transporter periplasmic adaptor subunit [Pedobacter sp. MC2016-15]|uniref:efflux RND transporter periplasmic adaptor subunit n=1 Tax=Pedobacter sp. MC2016-15 TaxID=2994473 RepID=UPI0022465F35|nr:efflux RND transporter periplasmic adaptor subunit [Pedobacter sp. MC2016-15]MCX2480050.1 efflux RND transporter periplasmic adaptor subunit [Pedobacter sp. MC2016-15]
MQTQLKKLSMLTLSILTTALILQGCAEHPKEQPKEDKFVLTDSLLNRLLIDTVKDPNSETDLSFSAKIAPNEETTARIFPMVSGNVRSVPVKLGDHVSKGQVLATLGSPEMASFDKDAISSSAELNNAKRNVKLAQDMYNSGLSSARELEEAKNDFLVKQAEDRRSRAVLNLNGGSTNGSYTLKTPISGFVIEKNINNNMTIRPDNNQSLFTVADLSNVWGIVNIYESDISSIQQGDPVKISILSYPDKVFTGKIDKIYNVLDPDSKVMNARVVIPNPGLLLKPGMMATVQIAAKTNSDLPSVNVNTIVFDENKNYVLVLDKVKKVRVQEVTIERQSGDTAYISTGLKAGDRIVASKTVFLYQSLKD